uniref:Uncharacterized protein n=1 Tax=Glossina pallidipes TaxID=7398 RepID=A0A1B0A989_GLOPL
MYLYGCRVYLLVPTVVLVGAVVDVAADDSCSRRCLWYLKGLRLAGDFSIIFLNLFRVVLKTAFAVVVAAVVVSHDAYPSVVVFALEEKLVEGFGVVSILSVIESTRLNLFPPSGNSVQKCYVSVLINGLFWNFTTSHRKYQIERRGNFEFHSL